MVSNLGHVISGGSDSLTSDINVHRLSFSLPCG